MTPAKAIRIECNHCKGGGRFTCESQSCRLNDSGLSSLKKIRLYCLDCSGGSAQEVKTCTGSLLAAHSKCPLWEYRFGTNPRRKGIGRQGGNPAIRHLNQERQSQKQVRKIGLTKVGT